MDAGRLEGLLENFSRRRIAVLGDLFLDLYLEIDPRYSEISRETGIPTWPVARHWSSPGASGTVMANLEALGAAEIFPIAVIGSDFGAWILREKLDALGIRRGFIIESPERNTPIYTKLVQEGEGKLWEKGPRLDFINTSPTPPGIEARIQENLRDAMEKVDALAVLDQVESEGLGVVTPGVRALLSELAARYPDRIYTADSRTRIGLFRGLVVKCNAREAMSAVDMKPAGDPKLDDVLRAGEELARRAGRPAIVTIGAEGILVFGDGPPRHVLGVDVPVVDIVGAGDSVGAAVVLTLAAGGTPLEAAVVGNHAASITVAKPGTGTASRDEIRARFRDHPPEIR